MNLFSKTNKSSYEQPKTAPKKYHRSSGNYTIYPIESLEPYPNHPFKPYTGQRLDDMVESVRENGIMIPIIVRHNQNGKFVILSGHNRVNAATLAGYADVPVIVKNHISDEEARLLVTETNLMQRSFSDLSHSERAICLAHHYEAMKCQGRRNDLLCEIETLIGTCSQIENKCKSLTKIGDKYGLSKDKVARYIRMSKLVPELLELVDNDSLAFLSAYQLSFIEDESVQTQAAEFIQNGGKLDIKSAETLREHYENSSLTDENIKQVLCDTPPPEKKPQSFKLSTNIINEFFKTEQDKKAIEETITAALRFYYDRLHDEEKGFE